MAQRNSILNFRHRKQLIDQSIFFFAVFFAVLVISVLFFFNMTKKIKYYETIYTYKVKERERKCVCVWSSAAVHSPVLHHDVLMRHQAVVAVVPPLPPVMWCTLEELQGRSLLEGELAARPAHVIEPRHRLHSLTLCRGDGERKEEEGGRWR